MLTFYLLYVYDEEDESQFERLYHQYKKQVFNICRKILNNQLDAEEAAQDAWITVAKHMPTLRKLDVEKTEIYIFKVAKSRSINKYNKIKREESLYNLDGFANIASKINVEDDYAAEEELKTAISCLTDMKACYRDVLTLYLLFEMKPAQIAESLDRPLQTVKSQLQRGKQILQEALGEWKHD